MKGVSADEFLSKAESQLLEGKGQRLLHKANVKIPPLSFTNILFDNKKLFNF